MIAKSTKKKINRNLGVESLRVISCFWVVLFHCIKKTNNITNYIKSNTYHVPCFFFISFYYLYPIICLGNVEKMKNRLKRLLIPYIFWILIFWIIYNSSFLFTIDKILLALNNLKTQLIIGRSFAGHLWFMFNLIFFTIVFFIISFLFKEINYLTILQLSSIVSYILQYSRINYNYFINFNSKIKFSVGYFVETIPFAASAFLLSSFKLEEKFKKYRKKNLIIISIYLYFIIKYKIFSNAYGFGFQGIDKNIVSIFLFIEFYSIPFEYLKPNFLYNFINACTRYTQGIYYLHIFISKKLELILRIKGSFLYCIIIYLIGYLISFIGAKIAGKNILKYLF